jgi:hypothetical protein
MEWKRIMAQQLTIPKDPVAFAGKIWVEVGEGVEV